MLRAGCLHQMRLDLDQYGYNHATIFPDLTGLAAYFQWVATSSDMKDGLFQPENARIPRT